MTDPDIGAMTGLELLRREAEQPADVPNIRPLLGTRFEELAHGRVVMSLETRPDFSNPLGTVHRGIAGTLLDSVLGCAVHSTLPAGVGYTTLELKVTGSSPRPRAAPAGWPGAPGRTAQRTGGSTSTMPG